MSSSIDQNRENSWVSVTRRHIYAHLKVPLQIRGLFSAFSRQDPHHQQIKNTCLSIFCFLINPYHLDTMVGGTKAVSSSFYLPLVDISPFLQDPTSKAARKVIEDVHHACISTGFFQIIGHGVPASVQNVLFESAARFFALPSEVKYSLDARKTVGFRGYDASKPFFYPGQNRI